MMAHGKEARSSPSDLPDREPFSMLADRAPFRLVLPSDPKVLPLARAFVEHVCRLVIGDGCFAEAMQMAAHEALQNVIRHAHGNRCDILFELQARPIPDGIEFCLMDEGEPFDVASVPHLDPGELRLGGRGVFLMRRLVDELCSEPRQPRGNVLRLVKRWRPMARRHPA